MPGFEETITMRDIFLAMTLLFLFAGFSHADDDGGRREHENGEEHEWLERAYKERQLGELKPVGDLMRSVIGQYGGQIIETELEVRDGRIVYEFYVLQDDGRVREVYVDGKTGEHIATYTEQ